jgi:transposase-like protein
MATIKQIEITTVRFIFTDDEQKEPVTITKEVTREQPKPRAEIKAAPKQAKPVTDKRTRHLWTDDEKREAMRMYADGVDMDIIVEKFGSTPQSVQKIMQKAGIRRPWLTKGNPSKVAEAEPEAEPVPVPSAEELEAEDRQRKADLREYRKQHPKPYYLNR